METSGKELMAKWKVLFSHIFILSVWIQPWLYNILWRDKANITYQRINIDNCSWQLARNKALSFIERKEANPNQTFWVAGIHQNVKKSHMFISLQIKLKYYTPFFVLLEFLKTVSWAENKTD